MKAHPAAEIFPMMGEKEFAELKADIEKHGVRETATVCDGKILDGRNRARACDELGIDLPCQVYEGDDPFGFVVSLNLHRRHLNESQRAMIAARMARLPKGVRADRQDASIDASTTQDQAAELLHVSRPTVQRAKSVLESGDALVQSLDWHIENITESWRQSVEGIFETGRRVQQALDELPHGEKGALWQRLPFGQNTGHRLANIAADQRLLAYTPNLPAAWATLYELTQLPDDQLPAFMESGEPIEQKKIRAWRRATAEMDID